MAMDFELVSVCLDNNFVNYFTCPKIEIEEINFYFFFLKFMDYDFVSRCCNVNQTFSLYDLINIVNWDSDKKSPRRV